MYKEDIEIHIDQFPENTSRVRPSDGFIESIRKYGILQPVIFTEYNGEITFQDGNKRVLALRLLLEGLGDQANDSEWDPFKMVPAIIYHDVEPNDSLAIAVILNEQRDSNPIQLFQRLRDLKEGGQYDQFWKIIGVETRQAERALTLGNLDDPDYWLGLYLDGKITENNLFSVAKLNEARQDALRKNYTAKVEEKGDNARITTNDLREVKTVVSSAALLNFYEKVGASVEKEKKENEPEVFWLLWNKDGNVFSPPFEKRVEAVNKALESGYTLVQCNVIAL